MGRMASEPILRRGIKPVLVLAMKIAEKCGRVPLDIQPVTEARWSIKNRQEGKRHLANVLADAFLVLPFEILIRQSHFFRRGPLQAPVLQPKMLVTCNECIAD